MAKKRETNPGKVEQVRAVFTEVRDDDIAASPVPASESPPGVVNPPPGNEPAAGAAGRNLTIRAGFEVTERQRVDAIERSAEALLNRILAGVDARAVWNLREAVWPALCLSDFRDVQLQQVQLTLFPLSRFGQMEGKSGSLVLVGRFSAQQLGDLQSHPLVIKTRDRTKPDPTRLDDEFKNACAVKPFAYDSKDSFAIPVFFDDAQDGYKVLWSICSLSGPVWRNVAAPPDAAQPFKVDDLRTPIREGKDDRVRETLKEVFDLLRNCHCRFNLACTEEKVVGEEYAWYLRGFGVMKAPGTVWGPEWVEVWGDENTTFVGGGEAGQVNPVWLVARLRQMKCPMRLGTTHGDLHPGNVVFSRGGRPAIIDFGWAQEKAHIAKDFVLMECNFRFLELRPQLKDEELEQFVGWVSWGAPLPPGLGDYLTRRGQLVQMLREEAAKVFPGTPDWDREYLIPLFLVAFGLLRFAPQLGNQRAAVRFVLALAMHVAQALGL